jgi:hypothetical protein
LRGKIPLNFSTIATNSLRYAPYTLKRPVITGLFRQIVVETGGIEPPHS